MTFKFCVLAFVVCPVLLNGAMETLKGSDKNGDVSIHVRLSYFYLLPFLSACQSRLGHSVLCKDVLSFVFVSNF